MADREQPCHPVEDRSEVIVVAAMGGASVNRHPGTERTGFAPAVRGECPLSLEHRADREADGVERGEKPVASRLDDDAAHVRDGRRN
jgi:hypothetical protein